MRFLKKIRMFRYLYDLDPYFNEKQNIGIVPYIERPGGW